MEKKKVLVVDDEKFFTELLKSNLELTGKFEVRTENGGANAASVARDFDPDIVLLDIVMPGMSGVSVAEQFQNDEKIKSTPVIFLTALATTEKTVDEDILVGNHPFIAKPISLNDLIICIEKYARK